jgi:hypothetical protein
MVIVRFWAGFIDSGDPLGTAGVYGNCTRHGSSDYRVADAHLAI